VGTGGDTVSAGKAQGKGLKGKLKTSQFTKDQSSVILLIVKMVLQGAQQMRDVSSILFDTFLIPSLSTVVEKLAEQGRLYSEAVAQKGHGLGDPHLYIFGCLLDCLANLDQPKEEMKQALVAYESWEEQHRAETIRMCHLVKLYKQESKKLVLSFGPGPEAQELRKAIIQTMCEQKEWEFKQGRPPAGHMERLLSQWATDIVS
jgi:hypothetical protein